MDTRSWYQYCSTRGNRTVKLTSLMSVIVLPLVGLAFMPEITPRSPSTVSIPHYIYSDTQSNNSYIPPEIDSTWRFTFDDEFNGTSVDWSKWKDGGQDWGSGGNGEEEGYIPGACAESNGILQLVGSHTAVTVQGQQRSYSSCMLNTIGTFAQTYGYFEFRGEIPSGQGYWPAFWLYDKAYQAPEIDVMENIGNDTSTYYMTYHYSGGQQEYVYHGQDLSAGYHTYGVKWIPGSIAFYLDDTLQYTVTSNVSSNPMDIFMNLAIGGNWPGSPNASTVFPGYFDVDYVRGWSLPTDSTNPIVPYPTTENAPAPTPTPVTTARTTPTPVTTARTTPTPAPVTSAPPSQQPTPGTGSVASTPTSQGPTSGGVTPSTPSGTAPSSTGPFGHITRFIFDWGGVAVMIVSSAGILYVLRDSLGRFVGMLLGGGRRRIPF